MLLDYDPLTGDVVWRERKPIMFGFDQAKTAAWNAKNAGRSPFSPSEGSRYQKGRVAGIYLLKHRAAWALAHGYWPEDHTDHINGDTSDDRLCNLRAVTASINGRNRRVASDNVSGVTGVHWYKPRGRWRASCTVNGKRRDLGLFRDKEDAIAARRNAERELGYGSCRT